MFHLCGYTESLDSATLANIAALADPTLTVSGDNIQVPEYASMLAGAYALGANTTRAQLQSPSLRRLANQEIYPCDKTAEPVSVPPLRLFGQSPIQLDINEQIQALASEDAAGAAQMTVLVWLTDKAIEPITGEIIRVRVTNASTLVAYTWTNGALTFDQVLPVGRYAIVGARFESAGLLAFRFVFQNQTARPGMLGYDLMGDVGQVEARNGNFGSWGEFDSTNPPTVDFLSLSADASQVGIVDLIKIG